MNLTVVLTEKEESPVTEDGKGRLRFPRRTKTANEDGSRIRLSNSGKNNSNNELSTDGVFQSVLPTASNESKPAIRQETPRPISCAGNFQEVDEISKNFAKLAVDDTTKVMEKISGEESNDGEKKGTLLSYFNKSGAGYFSKKNSAKPIKIKSSKSLNIETPSSLLQDEEMATSKKKNRKSLESAMEVSYSKEKHKKTVNEKVFLPRLKTCTSHSLGVLDHTSALPLQTNAFHTLQLNDLITSSEKLDNIKIYLKKHRSLLEYKTLVDASFEVEELRYRKTKEDTSFFKLLNHAKIKKPAELLGGSFVNTYPCFEANQINCDCYHAEKHSDYSFSILADGCGLGEKPRKASQRAVIAAAQFINQTLAHSALFVQTAENMAWVLVQSIAMAHEAIVSFETSGSDIGTTTLNICFVFMTPQKKKYLMVAGVGDCKAFLATQSVENHYQVIDVSPSKRVNPDPRDPGGRIGPQIKVGQKYVDPDLRNLSVACIPLPEGESIIFNMSDGMHDNFTPYQRGVKPSEVDNKLDSLTQWSELPEDVQQALEKSYQIDSISLLINEIVKKEKIDLDGICASLTAYCNELTSPSREFMVENPTQHEPADKIKYPGKMDHCSVVAFKV